MYVDFGSRLNNLSDEMCQMNTKIGRITRRKSRLDGYTPSPSLEPTKESSSDGDDDDDVDGSSSSSDIWDDDLSVMYPLSPMTKRGSSLVYESSHYVRGELA